VVRHRGQYNHLSPGHFLEADSGPLGQFHICGLGVSTQLTCNRLHGSNGPYRRLRTNPGRCPRQVAFLVPSGSLKELQLVVRPEEDLDSLCFLLHCDRRDVRAQISR